MSLSHARSMVSTQSQLDVCGAPTSTARCGTVPTVRHRASRSRRRARLRRTKKGRATARTYRLNLRRRDEPLHQRHQPPGARLRQVAEQRLRVQAGEPEASARTSGTSGSRCRTWVRRSVASRRRSTRPRLSRSSTICTTLAPLTPSVPGELGLGDRAGRLQGGEAAEVRAARCRSGSRAATNSRCMRAWTRVTRKPMLSAQRLGSVGREVDLGDPERAASRSSSRSSSGEPGRDASPRGPRRAGATGGQRPHPPAVRVSA